jgi:hypothetical protein
MTAFNGEPLRRIRFQDRDKDAGKIRDVQTTPWRGGRTLVTSGSVTLFGGSPPK